MIVLRPLILIAFVPLALVILAVGPIARQANAQTDVEQGAETGTQAGSRAGRSGLPVPRFVALRSDEVNLRTGPGSRYPIDWVFVRKDLPVEVVAEFDTWRRIRDSEGVEGWVHQSMLSGERSFVVLGPPTRALRAEPEAAAAVVARVEPGIVGRLLRCPAGEAADDAWCYCEIGDHRGWLPRAEIWGVYADETVE